MCGSNPAWTAPAWIGRCPGLRSIAAHSDERLHQGGADRLADLLGEQERVHFGALKDGSARILAKVEQSARQDVFMQLAKMRLGATPAKITKLNDYLGSKGWRGELKNAEGGVIIQTGHPLIAAGAVDTLVFVNRHNHSPP